jgi:hypothetical protein
MGPKFSGKNPNGNTENEVSMTCDNTALYDEISSYTIAL